MPEFILDHGTAEASERFAALDDFTQAYITAAFWLAQDGDDDQPDWSLSDLAEETWRGFEEDCREFQQSFSDLLARAYMKRRFIEPNDPRNYTAESAGHDFWLTRNGHGAGFWDRGLDDIGDELTKMSKPYGSTDLYRGDDDRLYLM